MGKNDFLTPKAIANRIKAKGLQKLRWYCQMCQKQCRDENGFKCHCMSESHQRQMQVFGQNPERFVDGYSQEFETSFLEHIKRTHRFSRVAATVVYNEYISDRHHIHMNSTQWTTLTEFVKHLGRTGKCKIDETPKGWFITYIDREPETLFKEGQKAKRERSELAEEDRHERAIQEQIERAAKTVKIDLTPVEPEKRILQRNETSGEKIAFSFGSKGDEDNETKSSAKAAGKLEQSSTKSSAILNEVPSVFDDDQESETVTNNERDNGTKSLNPRSGSFQSKSTLEQLMIEQEKHKEKLNRKDYWLCEGIVVKVLSKALKEKGYYKQKGAVVKVIGKYVAELKMNETGHVLRVDQAELETVLPQIGGTVRIVNGAYRGETAVLKSINPSKFNACVEIVKGVYDGRVLSAIDYEDICKFVG